MTKQRGRRELLVSLVLLASGGVGGLVSAGRTWGTVTVSSPLAASDLGVGGRDLLPAAYAVSLVALAAIVAVPATRTAGRRVVGAVLAVLGGTLAILAVSTAADLREETGTWAERSPDVGGSVEVVATAPAWAWLTAVSGLVILLAGTAVAVRGPSWPGMGRTYERRAGNPDGAAERASRRSGGPSGARDTWDALDRGDDPTDSTGPTGPTGPPSTDRTENGPSGAPSDARRGAIRHNGESTPPGAPHR